MTEARAECRPRLGIAALLACLNAAMPVASRGATPTVINLEPGSTRIELTIYAMGLFPLPAHFSRFSGTLSVDPVQPTDCVVAVRIESDSLQMADQGRMQLALGPKLLDAAHYPELIYQGSCANGKAAGMLTLHGVTKPLALVASRVGDQVAAEGTLKRQDFGVDGLPGLIGRTIKISFGVSLPPGLAARIVP